MTKARKILFVDDESMILSSLKRETRDWLEDAGLEYVCAESVDSALALISADPDSYLVVVSDLKMPQKKGSVLLEEVLRSWPLVSTILLTGFSEMEDIKSCIRSGIISFIQKPWDPDMLKAEVLRGVELSRLKRSALEHQARMEEELSWAKKINKAILVPHMEASGPIETGLAYRPHSASDCGGDFFRIYPGKHGSMTVCLGDVAVQGVQGTYFALMIREELNGVMQELDDRDQVNPAEILEKLNDRLIQGKLALPDTVMTLSVLVFQPAQHRLVYACAGGEEFILARNRTVHRFHLPSPGLGYQEHMLFTAKSVELQPRDLIFMGSDGINQAQGGDLALREVAFGMDPSWPAQELADHAMGIIQAGLGGGFKDDATIMVIKHA